ncbi:hypothetical protein HXX76_006783 [Chlamydomonas incerta]|uniref:Uncharacterized protein n=1 Tax=Chlamydomonas incerta TaxID=51695 RepID=A0A835W0W4_CHLIN|nr:hypothetical protein HXX76_006783 [Chlamydomonas incerta]|eukprot:KAG2436482.1 hypothetical protein HXX76_006783 [Chlamydomonas incerta]
MAGLHVARVAKAASCGGHAHVLEWLAADAGLYDAPERGDRKHKRMVVSQDLAAAAARGGRVSLLHRLLAKLQANGDSGQWPRLLLCEVALGCRLPAFRDLAEWSRQLEPLKPGARVAAAAAAAEGGGTRQLVGHSLFDLATVQPDFERRLRYLVSNHGAGAAVAQAATLAAVCAGDVGALRFLLDECGVSLSDECICQAAAHGQDAVLEFLRGRGELPSCSCDGRPLGPAPVCVLACVLGATAVAAPRLGAEVQLQPLAQAGSVEQLEWALGVAVGGAGAAAAQGLAPAAQHLLLAALQAGNLAAASRLHARGLAPVLPSAGQVIGLCHRPRRDLLVPCAENQWKWLKAAFLASLVLPHDAQAAPTAGRFEAAASAGAERFGHKAEPARGARAGARAGHEGEREREREGEGVEGLMAARRQVVAGVERRFREAVGRESTRRSDRV